MCGYCFMPTIDFLPRIAVDLILRWMDFAILYLETVDVLVVNEGRGKLRLEAVRSIGQTVQTRSCHPRHRYLSLRNRCRDLAHS